MSVFVIGEAGSCHDGDFAKAVALIDVAKKAGADACKFQYWSDAARLAARRHAGEYLAVYERYAVPVAWLAKLKAECDARGIEFMCTVYLPEDIEIIAPWVKRFKIASFEAGDRDFFGAHLVHRKPIIVSVGMADGYTVNDFYHEEKALRSDRTVDIMHCTSSYPAPLHDANLKVLRWPYTGFSDHTKYVLTGAFAVCAGATILPTRTMRPPWTPTNC
jgi:N-acetylneuraminate synthase